ncbi:TetR/AcrR family transcriptional regulator [Neorhizobium alkalisoli]|jgi:AcrR family transcriptional regulator|uniref:TetR family transcriptional regulator n=1 Tax=Neorhizobium alkalisoli TaxID=528178 RepID=A0A561QNM8_9HYPH|nr:TetR/AcrR family transcriptional regulator [Neorhizobium alkalisoli]TWF51926.1 TetR family transcriptional regulator [Neorhizobium alkalisoli]
MARTLIRPGGRSERIQVAVHDAVRALISEQPQQELTIALIAARAEVPPSTIYRRWETLANLLEDVASERFLPDSVPKNTGSFKGDLELWLEQLVDDLSSGPGHTLLRERLNNVRIAQTAAGYTFQNLVCLCDRCEARGEPVPDPDRLMDRIFAPVVYRMFFTGQTISKAYQLELIANVLKSAELTVAFASQPSIRDYVLYENDPQ